jgi:hypothetical protein
MRMLQDIEIILQEFLGYDLKSKGIKCKKTHMGFCQTPCITNNLQWGDSQQNERKYFPTSYLANKIFRICKKYKQVNSKKKTKNLGYKIGNKPK